MINTSDSAIMGESGTTFARCPDPIKRLGKESSVPTEDSSIRLIPLTRGMFAIVDATDYSDLAAFKWCAVRSRYTWYAVRSAGRDRQFRMHRQILQAPVGTLADHINGNGLDNRRANLRLATHSQNTTNSRLRSSNHSGFRGVHWHKVNRKWNAKIQVMGRFIHLGSFATKELGAKAYEEAAKKYHGEFIRQLADQKEKL